MNTSKKNMINILFVALMGVVCFVAGCATDIRKGDGSLVSLNIGGSLLNGPASYKAGVGKEQSAKVASFEPPDFSDAEKYNQHGQ